MPASITAKPNPVLISRWNDFIPAKTTVTWDTGSSVLRGQLYLSVDGSPESLFDGGTDPNRGSRTNSTPPKSQIIELGKRYEFRLRQVNAARTQLASIQVTAKERLGLPETIVDEMHRQVRRKQRIFNLRVIPGIESARFTFRTTQPTAPVITLSDGQSEFTFPLDQTKREIHDILVARDGSRLRQDADHTYRIFAAALPDSLNQASAESKGTFRTGRRTAQFFFDRIKVRNDGDHGWKGAGEFTFAFGAGDADPSGPNGEAALGNVEFYGRAEIADDDPPVAIDRVVTVPHAPPRLWAQVNAMEEDDDPFEFAFGRFEIGGIPTFRPPGNRGLETATGVFATVTQHFEIREEPGVVETPFVMDSGDWGIAYTVFGRLRVDNRPGVVYLALGRAKRPMVQLSRVATLRHSGVRARVGTESGRAHWITRAAGGGLYHAAPSEEDPMLQPWVHLGDKESGPVTVVAVDSDRVALFTLDATGSVLYRISSGSCPPNPEWQSLGGAFVGPIAAVPGTEGRIDLFVLSKDGCVFHGAISASACGPAIADWRPLGHGVHSSLTAFESPGSGLGVLALDSDGCILHKRWDGDTWLPSGQGWDSLGSAPLGFFSASLVDDGMLLLAVLSDDETIHALRWGNYPDALPVGSWEAVGTIDSLLGARMSLLKPHAIINHDVPTGPSLTAPVQGEKHCELDDTGPPGP